MRWCYAKTKERRSKYQLLHPPRCQREKLDAYCEDVGQTATMAIERILDDYLTKYMADKENASEGGTKADTVK